VSRICLSIKVDILPGTPIISDAIPQMISLAKRLNCMVDANVNGVKIIANPGDNEVDLALAWDDQIKSKSQYKIAMAWRGRELRVRSLCKKDIP